MIPAMEPMLALVCLCVGAWLGARLRDRQWADNADGEPRKEHNGQLYWVIRDGDLGKAERVYQWIREDSLKEQP